MSQATQFEYDRVKMQTQVSHGSDRSYVLRHALFHVLCQPSPVCIYLLFESFTQRVDQDMGRTEPRDTLEELPLQANGTCDG